MIYKRPSRYSRGGLFDVVATMNDSIDVIGLGCVAVDDLLYVDEFPAVETKVRIRRRERQCGGLTGTALVAAARLGARCAYAGILGDDESSRFVIDTFEREGIHMGLLQHESSARPIQSTVIVDESHSTRTVLFDLTGTVGAAEDHPPEDAIASSKILYVDHYGIEGMTRAARIARNSGVQVVADFERDEFPGFYELLELIDHLIVSHAFAARLTGQEEPAKCVARLWRDDRQAMVVTCGEQGCWYRERDSDVIRHQPAFLVDTVDPTGCGDVFHGAYAAALVKELPLVDRIRFASAAAACKAMHSGAQAGIPEKSAVLRFLQQQDL